MSNAEDNIVVELGMTGSQVETLHWILKCWLNQYEDNESSVHKNNAQAIYNALEGI